MLDRSLMHRLDRRGFVKASAAFGGGLTLTVALPPALRPTWAAAEATTGFAPNAFVRIDRQGAVTLVMPMVEMGQGTYTSLAMLLAEELEVGLDQVRLEHAPPNDALYANSLLHVQTTGLSASVRAFWTPLRQAGAIGRTLLIAAAAKRWTVDPSICRARHGIVSAGSRRLSYGELVDAVAALAVPAPGSVALKDPKDFTLIGTPAKRLDTPDKVNGRAEFGIDTKLAGVEDRGNRHLARVRWQAEITGRAGGAQHQRCASGGPDRQCRCRGRRPYGRGQERARGGHHPME